MNSLFIHVAVKQPLFEPLVPFFFLSESPLYLHGTCRQTGYWAGPFDFRRHWRGGAGY